MLYAIILGLPEKFLEYLKGPWFLVARLVRLAREEKADPVTALRYAVFRLGPDGRNLLRKALLNVLPVMSIRGLSYRQKEALLALRPSTPHRCLNSALLSFRTVPTLIAAWPLLSARALPSSSCSQMAYSIWL